jgi:hypothetical protein
LTYGSHLSGVGCRFGIVTSATSDYVSPSIRDYGTLEDLTRDVSLLSPHGIGGRIAAVTGPVGGGTPGGSARQPAHVSNGGVGDITSGGGGAGTSPASGVSPVGGSGGAGGGSGGGGAGGGHGGGGQLPFTGFPAVFAGAVGGVMAASGAALRRALRITPR